jgi:ABC-type oligopeptide transport system substrate-binding subunit
MHRRLWLSVGMLAVGVSLLVAAGFASPAASKPSSTSSTAKSGGTLKINLSATDVDFMDPALAYFQPSWAILYTVCRPLLNYPDQSPPRGSRLIADGAAAFPTVSGGGKVYTFHLRKGMRFSNGERITAKSYADAIDRDANPKMNSPSLPFFQDIIGATATNTAGGPKHVRGVKVVNATTLRISLTRPAPDILSRMAMPFFCPVDHKTAGRLNSSGVDTFAGSGPYYVAARTPTTGPIVLKRNTHYNGSRPHNASVIDIFPNTNIDTSYSQVQKGQINYDLGGLPPTAHAQLARKYGKNKSRYFVHPVIATRYLALNTSRSVFKNNNVRHAANYAVDRGGMIKLRGAFAGSPSDQLLPKNLRGYINANLFPSRPNFKKGKSLMKGKKYNATMYTSNSPIGLNQGALVQADFKQIGINVDVKAFKTSVMYTKAGTRGEPFDIANVGWIADYPDPYDFVNVLLSGDSIHASNNNNYSYWKNAKYTRQMNAAARLFGAKRYSTYGNLDVSIMKAQAPIAPWDNDNDRDFISAGTGCYVFHPVYGLADLAVLCRK